MKHTRALVVVFATVLYLAPLFLDAPLTDPDEGLHAVIAQEMHERGDFAVPRFLGRAFLDKPILFFWAQLASIKAFGMNTAAARLPGMLFALLGIVTTGWVARVLCSGLPAVGSGQQSTAGCQRPAASWLAATCYATMVLPFLLAQVPVHDMALVPLTNLAFGYLWKAGANTKPPAPNPKSKRWGLGLGIWDLGFAGLMLGLSILAKGLGGVAIVGIGYGAYRLLARTISWTLVWQGIAVVAIAVVVALPWYLVMEAREPGYLRYYFNDRHLLGFATDTQRHGGQQWWFYLPLVFGGGLPWILYMKGLGDRGKGLGRSAELLLWTWLVGAIGLLSLSGSKAVTYVLPAMPAIAILATRSWVVALSTESQDRAANPLRSRILVNTVLFLVIAALTPWAASRFGDQPVRAGEVVAFAVLSAVWLWLVIGLRRRTAAYAWPRLIMATGATYVLAFALLGPPLAQAHSARDLADYFSAPSRLPRTIYIMDGRVSFVYYLRPDVRRELRDTQVQSVSVEQLSAMQPFPSDAVVALPADLAGRLSGIPQLASASRQGAGRYIVVKP